MGYAERMVDEVAHHYAELRQRRMPALPALIMTLMFHHHLTRGVLYDDQFVPVIGRMLEPAHSERAEQNDATT